MQDEIEQQQASMATAQAAIQGLTRQVKEEQIKAKSDAADF